jgi:hypothetical protein
MKRLFDLFLSLSGLILLAPIEGEAWRVDLEQYH